MSGDIINLELRRRTLWEAASDHFKAANALVRSGDLDGYETCMTVANLLQRAMNRVPGQEHHEPGKIPTV